MRDPETSGQMWDRQPGESNKAWHAFTIYRDLGHRRSIDRAWDVFRASAERQYGVITPGAWSTWCKKWRWLERCAAYDAFFDAILQGRKEEIERANADAWVARRDELRQVEWQVARALFDKALAMLAFPLSEQVIVQSPNGPQTIIRPVRWSQQTVARFAQVASDLARVAADLPVAGQRTPSALSSSAAHDEAGISLALLQQLAEEADRLVERDRLEAGGHAADA